MEELIREGTQQGNSTGQIALGEFILKGYDNELSPKLKSFLEMVLRVEYEKVGKYVDEPAEDVAFEVNKIMESNV